MTLRFHNSLTRRLEDFEPLDPPHVRMYTCGPTVYNFAHIGNFRAYTFEDLLRRVLLYAGYKVTQVMNLTDIDDKTIRGCREKGCTLNEFTAPYIEAFFRNLDTLNIQRAEVYPKATEHVPEMVALVKRLLAAGVAYESKGSIYFSIAKFPDYGKLAHLDIAGLRDGARIDSDEYEKEEARDFALWKAWSAEDGDVSWDTELGVGRPGWHIECSAMSMKYLGESFDIHTGGIDNLFPHHENEIAQAEAATGKQFVRMWMHNAHLIVNGQKMSKSLGNFYTLQDLLDQGYDARAIRYVLLSTHYRQPLNFTFDGLDGAKSALGRVGNLLGTLKRQDGKSEPSELAQILEKAEQKFRESLFDDLNISPALAALFDLVRDVNLLLVDSELTRPAAESAIALVYRMDDVLGLLPRETEVLDAEVERMIAERIQARKDRDFKRADAIRDELAAQGILLEDTSKGTEWKRK